MWAKRDLVKEIEKIATESLELYNELLKEQGSIKELNKTIYQARRCGDFAAVEKLSADLREREKKTELLDSMYEADQKAIRDLRAKIETQ